MTQDENTGRIVGDDGQTVDVRPGEHATPMPTADQAEALAAWRHIFSDIQDEIGGWK